MSKAVNIDQIGIFTAISEELSRQHKKLPADSRSNAIIKAANMVVKAYSLSDEEFIKQFGATGEKL